MESVWLKHLATHSCFQVMFLSKKLFSQYVLSKLVEKCKRLYVLPTMSRCNCAIANFDLWICKGTHDLFPLVKTTFLEGWLSAKTHCHRFILSNMNNRSSFGKELNSIVRSTKSCLCEIWGSNLNIKTIVLKSILSCENVGLKESLL